MIDYEELLKRAMEIKYASCYTRAAVGIFIAQMVALQSVCKTGAGVRRPGD